MEFTIKNHILRFLSDNQAVLLSRQKRRFFKFIRKFTPTFSANDLIKYLSDSGIKSGDSLYIHSSMSKIGNLENGAHTVIEAISTHIGKDGTLGVPCHLSPDYIKKKNATDEILDLRIEIPHTGIIAQTIKNNSKSFCSSHPYASSCFFGKNSKWLTTGHENDFCVYHKDSPMYKLLTLNGKILGIGIDFAAIGFYHLIEDIGKNYPVDVYDNKFSVKYIDSYGDLTVREIATYNKAVSKTRVEKKDGGYSREILLEYLITNKAIYFFKFGRADAWVLNCNKAYNALVEMLDNGLTIYTKK
jgi:aminoglycoside 3-N-acetyltransferase